MNDEGNNRQTTREQVIIVKINTRIFLLCAQQLGDLFVAKQKKIKVLS